MKRQPNHSGRRRALAGIAVSSAAWLSTPAQAQTPAWPSRPIRVVVNFPAGGPLDILARQVAGQLSNRLGQPLAVENVTGAAGEIGAAAVARAQPDGYTILMSIDAPFTIARAMRPQGRTDRRLQLGCHAWHQRPDGCGASLRGCQDACRAHRKGTQSPA